MSANSSDLNNKFVSLRGICQFSLDISNCVPMLLLEYCDKLELVNANLKHEITMLKIEMISKLDEHKQEIMNIRNTNDENSEIKIQNMKAVLENVTFSFQTKGNRVLKSQSY